MEDRFTLADVHHLVDTALIGLHEEAAMRKRRGAKLPDTVRNLRTYWARQGRYARFDDGVIVVVRPVLTRHVAEQTAKTLVGYGVLGARLAEALNLLCTLTLQAGGQLDFTVEDYKALAVEAWKRRGTDTEDEAVLAGALRWNAAIITDDRDFRQYLGDRRHAAFTLEEFGPAFEAGPALEKSPVDGDLVAQFVDRILA